MGGLFLTFLTQWCDYDYLIKDIIALHGWFSKNLYEMLQKKRIQATLSTARRSTYFNDHRTKEDNGDTTRVWLYLRYIIYKSSVVESSQITPWTLQDTFLS
jgi:hypothetical protein